MRHRTIAALLITLAAAKVATAAPKDYFAIRVVDDATGRGVPLAYLRSVYKQTYVTDSAGYIAFNEPGLMNGVDVWVSVKSYGYEEPAGAFGIHGVSLKPKAGGTQEIRIKRTQVAERLYRMTGYGIYRDSVLLGKKSPIDEPLLNAQVTGSDTVQCAIYKGKLFWNWQDTDRVGFELGNFSMTGATTDLPAKLTPDEGLSFTYFVAKPGEFAKAMAQVQQESSRPIWADGLTVVPDKNGRERMIAKYITANKDLSPAQAGLLVYDDDKQIFTPLAKYSGPKNGGDTPGPGGHAIYVRDNGVRYVYYGGNVRVKADFESASDPKQYESFTCLTADGKADRKDGKLVWQWRKNAKPVNFHNANELVKKGVIKAEESPYQLKDVESGKPLEAVSAGIAWNDYTKSWVNIFGQRGGDTLVGEIWVSTAASPEGPWVAARKVATHAMEKNSNDFYNPVQHYELNQDGGRYVYFSGTFVNTFSGNPWPTPYYNYNNIVYRLDMSDPRLKLPAPPPGLSQTKPDDVSEVSLYVIFPTPRFTPLAIDANQLSRWLSLLVVIGIIGLLVSILLPTVTTVRRSAVRTACAMQLRDLGNAFQMYINDAKGRIPGEINPLPLAPPTKPNLPTLFQTFDRYLGNVRKSWVCPADRMIDADLSDPVLAGHERYAEAYGVSYEYNFYMNVLSPGQPFVKILGEAQSFFKITPNTFRVLNDLTHFHGPTGRIGNMNFLFADWHVGDLEGKTSGKLDNPGGKL